MPPIENVSIKIAVPERARFEYELLQYLTQLYGEGQAVFVRDRLIGIAEQASTMVEAPQKAALSSADAMLICYGDTLISDVQQPLQTLSDFASAKLKEAFSGIHILPFFPSSSDDGFAVIDYEQVRPDLGSWSDIGMLAQHFDLMFDLVINHCSRENLWFADFVGDRPPGNEFFHHMIGPQNLTEVVRPRNTPLLTQVHTYSGIKEVWTTFSEDQVDLNFANPKVLLCFTEILFSYYIRGARFLRLDAVAFIWKRIGTRCMSLPETHMLVRVLRLLVDIVDLPLVLLTETNVPHEENVSYFGDGAEAHMVYQFSLAPLLLHSYLSNDAQALVKWTEELAPPPAGCSYLNFIATHDGICLRPLEGLLNEEALQELLNKTHERGGYAAMRTAADGKDKAYELNISLFSAFGGKAENIGAYVAAHQLLMAYQGLPALYLHSLVGSLNDLERVESTGRTRSINRGQWDVAHLNALLDDANSHHALIFKALTRSLTIRREQAAFSPEAFQQFIAGDSKHLVLLRDCTQQSILVIASFADHGQSIAWPMHPDLTFSKAHDLLTDSSYQIGAPVALQPYQVLWLHLN